MRVEGTLSDECETFHGPVPFEERRLLVQFPSSLPDRNWA